MTRTLEQLAHLVHQHRASLCAGLRASAWGSVMRPEDIDDAISAAFLAACQHPEPFHQALARGDTGWVRGRFLLMAKRKGRDAARRHHRTRELGAPLELATGGAPPIEELVFLHIHLDGLLREAAARVCPRRVEPLTSALRERMRSGQGDAAVSRRTGLPREYICRARRAIESELKMCCG